MFAGKKGETFKDFLLQARVGRTAIGQFASNKEAKTLDCGSAKQVRYKLFLSLSFEVGSRLRYFTSRETWQHSKRLQQVAYLSKNLTSNELFYFTQEPIKLMSLIGWHIFGLPCNEVNLRGKMEIIKNYKSIKIS